MALLSGQSWGNACPYLWDHCGHHGNLCDGCTADADERKGYGLAPWAQGTDVDHRHYVVRQVAAQPGTAAMERLLEQGIGWFD